MIRSNAGTHRLSPVATAISLALLAPFASAYGQEATPPATPAAPAPAASDNAGAPAARDGSKLETVIVTSSKRAENLMSVPAAVTVLSDTVLQRNNVSSLDDLPALSPALSITYSTQPGNYSINMRGIGTFSLGIGVESDVSVVIDDIPVAIQANAFQDMADIGRVEVLKGPQSTLFGKASIAGVINMTTKPITGPLTVKASTFVTNDNQASLTTSISGAIDDHFRMRIAATTDNFDGTVKNLDGGHENGQKDHTLLGKFEWAPTDDLVFTLSPHYNYTDKNCCVQPFSSMTPGGEYSNSALGIKTTASLPANLVLGGIPIGPNNVTVRNDYQNGGIYHDYGSGFKIDYLPSGDSVLAGHTLSSITSYDRYHMNDYQDGDATDWDVMKYSTTYPGYTGGSYQFGTFDVRSFTQEFRLTSPNTGRLRYVAGLWYAKNRLWRDLTREPVPTYSTDYDSFAFNTNAAIYGQGTYDFTQKDSLILGLRSNLEHTGYSFTQLAPPPAQPVVTGHWGGENAEHSVTGKAGLEHHFATETMGYFTYSTGHKGKAYDLTSSFSAVTALNQPIPGENAKSFELGYKTMFLDDRAMLNAAIFNTTFTGFQQSASELDSSGVFVTQLHSIGELRTRGLELDGAFQVTSQLNLTGSFAFTQATVMDFPNGPCYTVLNAAGTTAVNAPVCAANAAYGSGVFQNEAGKTMPNAPKYKGNVGGQYNVPLANESFDLFYTGAYRWQSATQFNLDQDPGTIQPSYGILNAGVGVKGKNGLYKVSLFVNNLLDKRYAAGLVNTPRNGNWSTSTVNVSTTQWTPPRDYTRYFGVRLDLSF